MATVQDLNYRVSVSGDAQIGRLTRGILELNAAMYSSSAATQTLDAQLRGFGRRTVEVGRYLTRHVTLPLALIGTAAVKTAHDFEESMSRIRSMTNTSAATVESFRKTVLDLNNDELLQGPKDLADALYFVRSSGVEANKTMEVMKASSAAAFAGLGDIATVADVATSAMNAYGSATTKANYVTDTLIKTVELGKAEPNELASSIGRVIPLAAQMGVEFAEVGASIATMTQQGLSADLAVTGLRAELTTFTRALPTTQKALAAMGFKVDDVNAAIADQGLQATMQRLRIEVDKFDKSGGKFAPEMIKAFQEGGEEGATAFLKLQKEVGNTSASLLSKLFPNVRALTAFLIQTSGEGKKAMATLRQIEGAGGATGKALQKALENPAKRFDKALNDLQKSWTKFSEQFLPPATKLVGVLTKILDVFNGLPKPIQRMIALTGVLVAFFGPLITAIGMAARLYSVKVLGMMRSGKLLSKSQDTVIAGEKMIGTQATQTSETVVAAVSAEQAAYDRLYGSIRNVVVLTKEQQLEAERYQRRQLELQGVTQGGPFAFRSKATGRGIRQGTSTAFPNAAFPNIFPPLPGQTRGQATTRVGYRSAFSESGKAADTFFGRITSGVNKALPQMSKFRGSLVRVGGALATVGRFVWPIALIEGTILVADNMDYLVEKVVAAQRKLEGFKKALDKFKGPSFLDFFGIGKGPFGGSLLDAIFGAPAESEERFNLTKKQIGAMAIEFQKLKKAGLSTTEAMREITVPLQGALGTANQDKIRQMIGGQLGKAIKMGSTLTIKQIQDWMTGAAKKAYDGAANIAKNAAKGLSDNIAKMRKALEDARDEFSTLWDRMTDDIMSAFDARTDTLVEHIRYNVSVLANGIKESFTLVGDALTPAEKALERMDAFDRKVAVMKGIESARKAIKDAIKENRDFIRDSKRAARDAAEDVADAQEDVAKATGRREVGKFRGFTVGFTQVGDPEERKRAQRRLRDALERQQDLKRETAERKAELAQQNKDLAQALKDAFREQRRYKLEERAKVERAAADKAHDRAVKDFEAQRNLQSRHLGDQLDDIKNAFTKGEITAGEARARVQAVMAKFGIDMGKAGYDMGYAFTTQLQESMAGVDAQMLKVDAMIAHIKQAVADLKALQAKAANTYKLLPGDGEHPGPPGQIGGVRPGTPPPPKVVPGAPPIAPGFGPGQPGTPSLIEGAPKGTPSLFAPQTTNNFFIANSADAASAVNRINRATNRR